MGYSRAIRKNWEAFYDNLPHLGEIRSPRRIFIESPSRVTNLGFADDSELSFAAAVYFYLAFKNGYCWPYLIYAKTRLAQLKLLSIPRLDLCAAELVNTLRYLNSLKGTIPHWSVNSTVFCLDLSTVLAWFHLPHSRLKSFVDESQKL